MFSCTLFLFIFISYGCKSLYSNEVVVKAGAKINICCTLNVSKDKALSLWKGSTRLAVIYDNALSMADFPTFESEYKNFNLSKENGTICLKKEKVTTTEANLKLNCTLVEGMFGKTVENEYFIVKIFEELKFLVQPDIKSSVMKGGDLEINCEASGSPDLKVLWRKEGEGVVSLGTTSSILSIKNVSSMMDGDKYTCEASTSLPKNSPDSMIKQTTTLNVTFQPEIGVDVKAFHTDLGIKEEVTINIRGNPTPVLDCRLMNIAADRIITISDSTPHTYMYKIEFNNITSEHLGNYKCTVTNPIGSIEKTISLILGPTNLRIISTNTTTYSNYYFLKWEVDSKTMINTSKIFISEYNEGIDSIKVERTLEDKDLSPMIVSHGNIANNWRYQYSHHIMNLTSNKLYKVSVQMCRIGLCVDAENPVFVLTPQFNGKNQINPNELTSESKTGLNNLGGGAVAMKPLDVFCVIGANVILIHLLY